jgi:hypothetical protein
MMQEVPKVQPPAKEAAPRKARSYVGRIVTVAIILAVMLGLAHFLRNPAVPDEGPRAGSAVKAEGQASASAVPDEGGPGSGEQKMQSLRSVLAGVIMGAFEQEESGNDTTGKDAADMRQSVAELFGVSPDQMKNQAPEGVAPGNAQVLMVFDDPAGAGQRITLMRVPGDIDQALAAIYNHYKAAGYQVAEPGRPSAQTDRGWLVRFTKGNRERLVYARPRDSGKETLIAVYDEPR